MKTCMKRMLSVLLCAMLVVGNFPVSSNAAETQGAVSYEGTALNIAQGSVIIGRGTIQYGEETYSYTENQNVKVTGTTTEHQILVADGVSVNLTLSDVSIDLSGQSTEYLAAVEIADGSAGNVTITLEGDNVLKASPYAAALQKNGTGEEIGMLVLKGTGSLKAVGGDLAAGIGADDVSSTENIKIEDGVITALPTEYADGIGVSRVMPGYTVSRLVIEGGSLKTGLHESIVAVNSDGEGVMPLTIATDGESEVLINGKAYPKKHGTEKEIYAYLSIEDVNHVKVGEDEKDYFFYGILGQFVNHAKAPVAEAAVYGETLADVQLSTVSGGRWVWEDDTLSVGTVGTRAFTAQFVPDNTHTYYADPVTVSVTVLPKPITISGARVLPKEYDGTGNAEVTSVTFDGAQDTFTMGKDYTATAEFSDANAGVDKDVTVKVNLLNENYSLQTDTYIAKATIDKKLYYDIEASDVELTYGDTNGAVVASAVSGGKFSYAVTEGADVISVDETTGKITILKAGSASVKISLAGTANYMSRDKTISVTVNKKKIAPPQVNPENVFVYKGVPQTYVLAGTDDYQVTNATKTAVGTYDAIVTLTDPDNTEWAGQLPVYIYSITKAPVTITADDKYVKDTEQRPEYTYKISGLVNGETIDFVPTISCATDMTIGTYSIEITGPAESDNYTFTYKNGTLTVAEKYSQSITAENLEFTYGDVNRQIEAQTNGDGTLSYEIIEGEDVISVNKASGAITILAAGSATVKISATETENYSSAHKTIVIRVNKAENAPDMPKEELRVSCGTEYVGDVSLPTGWQWPVAARDDVLVAGSEVTDTAEYIGDDAGNYQNESVQIRIYRAAHTEGELLFDAADDVMPTCEEGGRGHVDCDICHKTIKKQVSAGALGHEYKALFVWSADGKGCVAQLMCKRDSSHTAEKSCEVTGKIKVPATCKSMGITTYTAVYGNDKSLKDVADIPQLTSHAWDDGVVTRKATTTAAGVKTYTCKTCGEKKTEEIAMLPLPKKGTTFKSPDGKAFYRVTKQGAEVEFKAPANKKSKKVVIPATVKADGITYKVTSVANNAFANNKKVTSVVIGKNIKKIGKKVFYNCKSLKTVTVSTTKLTAKNVGAAVWKGAGSKNYSGLTIKVPKKKLTAYKKLFVNKGLSSKAKVKK